MPTVSPLISVVLTTHNRAYFLKRAIDSVLNQTLIDFELIIVDDCSTDNTEELVKTFSDSRMRYVRHAQNRGVSAARNTGVDAAKADYVSFLDDDDEYLPQFLEKTQEYILRYRGVGFVWTGVNRVFEKNQKTNVEIWHSGRVNNQVSEDKEMIFLTQFAASCGLTVSTAAFKKVGRYMEEMTVSEDLELIFRMVASGCDYYAIPIPLIQVNIHPGVSLSRTSILLKHIQSTEYLIEKNLVLMGNLPLVWLHYHTVLLANYYRAGQVTNAHRLTGRILKMRFFYAPVWERIFRFELKRVRRFISN